MPSRYCVNFKGVTIAHFGVGESDACLNFGMQLAVAHPDAHIELLASRPDSHSDGVLWSVFAEFFSRHDLLSDAKEA